MPCAIGTTTVINALADLGESISIMPFSLFKRLGLGNPKQINMVIEMADRSMQSSKGIVKNVLVKINKFIFHVDFIILDIIEDDKVPIILGRPMLATAHARINVFGKKISLEVGTEQITFDINERESPARYGITWTLDYAVTSFKPARWKVHVSSLRRKPLKDHGSVGYPFDYRVTLGFDSIVGGLDHVNPVIRLPLEHEISMRGLIIYVASVIIHSESASGRDASAYSIAEADPENSTPNDFVPQQQGMDEGTQNKSYDHLSGGTDPNVLVGKTQSVSEGLETADFMDLESPEDDPIIVVDQSEKDGEEDKMKKFMLPQLLKMKTLQFPNLHLPVDTNGIGKQAFYVEVSCEGCLEDAAEINLHGLCLFYALCFNVSVEPTMVQVSKLLDKLDATYFTIPIDNLSGFVCKVYNNTRWSCEVSWVIWFLCFNWVFYMWGVDSGAWIFGGFWGSSSWATNGSISVGFSSSLVFLGCIKSELFVGDCWEGLTTSCCGLNSLLPFVDKAGLSGLASGIGSGCSVSVGSGDVELVVPYLPGSSNLAEADKHSCQEALPEPCCSLLLKNLLDR
uniref:Reverse transcriptase domain-containing protein n=1 Tax=Tanacetum cinerariifolium TaxID=118510 RepID=A0A6L2J5M7_TANCI|nr:hypothetical protein [Tanacetum cinerariifolium]